MNAVLGDIAHVVVAMYMLYGKSTENIVIHPKGSYSTVIDYSTKTTYNLYNMEYDINHRFMNVKGDRKNFTKAISLLLEFIFLSGLIVELSKPLYITERPALNILQNILLKTTL